MFVQKTYSLHNVLECVETDVGRDVGDLSIHGHCNSLAQSRENKRVFSADKRQLDGCHGNDSTENARRVDGNVV